MTAPHIPPADYRSCVHMKPQGRRHITVRLPFGHEPQTLGGFWGCAYCGAWKFEGEDVDVAVLSSRAAEFNAETRGRTLRNRRRLMRGRELIEET